MQIKIKKSKIYKKLRENSYVGLGVVFIGIFAIFGIILWILMFARPMMKILSAKKWEVVPCEIIKSEIDNLPSESGNTYKAKIQFKFQFNQKWYEGSSYNFNTAFSNDSDESDKIVSQYKVGFKTSCFVNPQSPSQAVLNRDFFEDLYWRLLFPSSLILISILGIFLLFRDLKKAKASPSHKLFKKNAKSSPSFFKNDKIIKEKNKWHNFLGFFLFGVLWNSFIILFVYQLPDFDLKKIHWALFLFPAAGIFLILGCIYEGIKFFNPAFMVELKDTKVILGNNLSLKLLVKGELKRLKKLTIALIGEENAISRGGSSSSMATNVFYREVLLETNNPTDVLIKSFECKIPLDKMCSFQSNNNAIVWKIVLKDDTKFYPKLKSEFIIKVGPHE